MTTTRSIADYAKQINACWRRTTDSVLETAALCAEAKNSLTKDDDRKALVEKLDFSPAAFSKLVTIGECKALQSAPVKALLPPNYSIVYELAKLEDEDLKRAVSDGVVSPSMSRASLKEWMGGATKADEQDVVFGTLRIPLDYDARRKMQLEAELEKLKAKFDFEFERPRDPMLEERERLEKRFDRLLRSRARAHIRDLKSQKLGSGRKKVAEDEARKLWPFSDADIKIACPTSAPVRLM
jgi:hypothetical protein